jgi:hypothetical protein
MTFKRPTITTAWTNDPAAVESVAATVILRLFLGPAIPFFWNRKPRVDSEWGMDSSRSQTNPCFRRTELDKNKLYHQSFSIRFDFW